MKKPVRILIVEEKPSDADLAKHEIRQVLQDCEFLVVETRENFLRALEIFQPDVILSDYALPHFDGMKALQLTRYHTPSTPFIIWTGSISEDVAVDCVKAGANNYILKENVKRLGPAILHALEEKELLAARQQAEQKYKSIFENSMEGIFQSSPQGRYLNVNPAMARLYGYESPMDMIESVKSIADQIYVNPSERAEFIRLLHSQNTVENYEQRNYRKDGSVIWTSTSARAVRDEKGNLLYYEGFIQDVTKRKVAEEALQNNEQRFRALIENGLDDISLLAADGSLLWESPSTVRNLGYIPGEFVGRNIFEMMHPEDMEWTRDVFEKLLREPGSRQQGLFRLRRADGTWRWVEAIATNLLNEPSVNAIVINYHDITEQRQAQEALQENQAKYQNLVETSHDLIWSIDLEGRFTFVNRASREIYGYEPEELIGRHIFELLDTEYYQPKDFETFREMVVQPNTLSGFETYVRHRDGRSVILSTNSIVLHDESGNITGISGSSHDITVRKKVEDVFREERNLLRTLIDNIPDRIYAMDSQGRKTLSNIADWKASGGKAMEDVIGKTDSDLYPEELAKEFWKLDQAVLDSGEPVINYEEPGIDPDGHPVSILTSKIPLRDDNGNVVGLVGIGRDITERKHTEEKLRQSENQYRLATKATNDVIWEWNPKTNQLLWSENATVVFGYPKEEIGPYEKWWDEHIHPDDRERVLTKLNALIAGSGSNWAEEYRFLLKKGAYAYISDRGYIERDELGVAVRMIGAMSDITSRKEAEVERQALLEIMQGLANTRDLQELLKLIHSSIAKVIYAENFFVVLYQENSGLFEEIYSVDQYDLPEPPSKLEQSITSYVFRSGESLLLTQESFKELAAQGEVKLIGTDSASWLGVPLKTSGRTIGVMVVQDYENENRYSEHDKDFLASIATQVALVIERKRAEESLHRSEALYRQAIEVAGAVPYYQSYYDEGKLIHYEFIGEGIRQITGYGPEEFSAKLWDSLVEEINLVDDLAGYNLDEAIYQVRTGKNSIWKCEHRLRARDGEIHWVFEAAVELRDENGISYGSIGMYQDITERKRAEQALREREEQYRAIFEGVQDAILVESLDGQILMVNERACEMFGYSQAEFLTRRVADLVPKGYLVMGAESAETGLSAEPRESFNKRANGENFPIEISGRIQIINGEQVLLVVVRDITERKRTEAAEHEQRILAEALRDSAETLSRTLDYGEVLDHILATVGRVVPHDAASILLIEGEFARVVRSLGYDTHGFSNREILGVRLPLSNTTNLRHMLQTKQSEVIYDTYTYPGWQRIPSTDWLRSSVGAPILIYGEVIGFICLDSQTREYFTAVHAERLEAFANQAALAIHNARLLQQAQEEIAERKRAEEAVRQSEMKARALLNALPDMMFRLDKQGVLLDYKAEQSDLYIQDEQSLIGKKLRDITPPEFADLIDQYVQKTLTGDAMQVFEYQLPIPGRGLHDYEARMVTSGQEEVTAIVRNITDRKRAEADLRASEERFRQLADNIQEAFWMTDAQTDKEIYMSPAVEKIWGQPMDYLMNEPHAFMKIVFPEDQPAVMRAIEKEKSGEKVDVEYRVMHPDGSLHWIWDRAFPIFDDSHHVTKIAGISADITDRREAELALIKSQSRYRDLFDSSPVSLWEEDFSLVRKRIDSLLNSGVTDLKAYFATHREVVIELARLVKVTDVNQASLDLYRVERKEDLLKSLAEISNEDVLEHFQEEVLNLLNTPNRFTWEGTETTLDGREMAVVVNGSIPNGYEEDWSKVIISINDITQRKQSEIEIRRHVSELEAVYENGLSVGRLLEPGEIGERVIETFARYLHWHHVTIRLRKEGSDDLELVAFNLPSLKEEEKLDAGQHFVARINRVGQGLSGWVIQTGNSLRTGNVHDHPQYIDTHVGIQSGLYMPLKVGDRAIGVISVESEMPDAFTEQDERLLATLANQTAIAFENARLYEAMQKELLERKRVEDALRISEFHYRALADSITDILFELDQDLHCTHWNKATETLTGIPAQEAIGKSIGELLGISEEQSRIKLIYEDVLRSQEPRTFETTLPFHGEKRYFETTAYPSLRGVSVVAKDVTDRKWNETIMQKRFELMEYSAKHSLNKLMLRTVDEISELTSSAIGFFHFMEEDQITLGMQTWSTNARMLFQALSETEMDRALDQAGIWTDAIQQRHPLIQNNYESLADKKVFSEGHVPIVREIVIPIIRNERIMAVMGIANKPQDYTSHDLEIATRLADYAWDITERKQMELALEVERNQLVERVEERTADLSRANSNLARALRVKDEFLANMSHELRTPLNAILGLSESLGEQIAGPLNEKQQKYIATISESGHHLLSLINDILDLAKIDAGQISLDINKVDIHSVCQASLRMIKQLAQKKHQEVLLHIDPGLGLMWADERRLKQMIVNLLGNAVKFTPEYGKLGLEVHGDEEANQIAITVWDNGIGIKQSDLARLFQPFVQLDSGLAREATGTGLGLALVAQMARLHGGSVNAVSESGTGSRFTLLLPWEPALAMDTVSRLKITGKFRAIQVDETNKPTILLVEDTKEVVMILKDYLELSGYRVFTAQDGTDGIVQARHVKPDLILMDVQMPGMDGFETTRKLRSDPNFQHTPIIALTALAMPHDRERCLEAGMNEYMSKPVNLKALVKIIQSCLYEKESRIR